jgi:hypothetical protein
MTRGGAARTSACDQHDAQIRLSHAQRFIEVADLVVEGNELEQYGNVAASLAVLAGIAASDATCCAALRRRSRSQDHHDAIDLLAEVRPRGAEASQDLRRLLALKDDAEYGVIHVGAGDLRAALRRARSLVGFAEQIVRL